MTITRLYEVRAIMRNTSSSGWRAQISHDEALEMLIDADRWSPQEAADLARIALRPLNQHTPAAWCHACGYVAGRLYGRDDDSLVHSEDVLDLVRLAIEGGMDWDALEGGEEHRIEGYDDAEKLDGTTARLQAKLKAVMVAIEDWTATE